MQKPGTGGRIARATLVLLGVAACGTGACPAPAEPVPEPPPVPSTALYVPFRPGCEFHRYPLEPSGVRG